MQEKQNYYLIEDICRENIETIFDKFNIDYVDKGKYYSGICPIHQGDNKTAFTYYKDVGVWKCWTHGCHNEYGKNTVGLVRGLLNCSYGKAIETIFELFGINDGKIPKSTIEEIEIIKFSKRNKPKKKKENKCKIYSESCLTALENNNYFLRRGFKQQTLDFFKCGFARRKFFTNRIVFPIRNINKDIVGFTGRVVYEKCKKCLMFHDLSRPCYKTWTTSSKWKKNPEFSQKVLYNLDNSRYNIEKTGAIVIVEGIPDVMRLHQNGVYNSVALLLGGLADDYLSILMSITGLRKIYLFSDNDKCGNIFKEKHTSFKDDFMSLSRYFMVEPVIFDNKKDIGDMNDEEASDLIEKYNYFQV